MTENKPFNSRAILLRRNDVIMKLSHYRFFSPIEYKLNRAFIHCNILEDYRVYYKRRYYFLKTKGNFEEFMENPDSAISVHPDFNKLPSKFGLLDVCDTSNKLEFELKGYCPVELYMNKLIPGKKHMTLLYCRKYYCFSNVKNYKMFKKHPYVFEQIQLPRKLPVIPNPRADIDAHKHGNIVAYLENYLSKIITNVFNYLNQCRIKYPKISRKETTMKLFSICLKAVNPNKADHFRVKYSLKTEMFLRQCYVADELMTEANRRKYEMLQPEENRDWADGDEENFLQLAEEYEKLIESMDSQDKRKYFQKFMR